MKKNKINNNITLKNNNEYYNIKNIAKYFEEPINEFDNNYISIKTNNKVNIFNNDNFKNNENNNRNKKNNDSSNHMDVNDKTKENEQNNIIYNLK